jgi:hypothetical protein
VYCSLKYPGPCRIQLEFAALPSVLRRTNNANYLYQSCDGVSSFEPLRSVRSPLRSWILWFQFARVFRRQKPPQEFRCARPQFSNKTHDLIRCGMSKAVQLSAKWQLDAALLSRPVDLTPLVSMSKSHPEGNSAASNNAAFELESWPIWAAHECGADGVCGCCVAPACVQSS